MLVHEFLESSQANGPGSRFVVWVQGCSRHCPGCFNKEAQSYTGRGQDMTPHQLLLKIPSSVTGLTVSGGEPFEQPGDLARLLRGAKNKGLSTLVYTGYTYDELTSCFDGSFAELIAQALCYTDLLIDGPYRQEEPPICRWAGSGNQHFYALKNGLIVEDLTMVSEYASSAEIVIDERGTIVTTGIIDGFTLAE